MTCPRCHTAIMFGAGPLCPKCEQSFEAGILAKLGPADDDRSYTIVPVDGAWWIYDKQTGSGEPLLQFLKR